MLDHRYHDFARVAREDRQFLDKLDGLVAKLGGANTEQLMQEVMVLCRSNIGFLLPWLFPNFGGPGKGLSLFKRPFSFPMYALLIGGYLCVRGSRQLGKTVNLVSKQLSFTQLIRPWTSCYIAPHPEHIRTYVTKMLDMEKMFRYYKRTPGYRNNQTLKEFPGGSRLEISRVLTSASHMRGKTFDDLNFDEYQLFDHNLEAEIKQTQRVSEYPTTLYSGTSTTIESPLEKRFQESTASIWHMKSPGSNRRINCGDPDLVLKMIRPKGLTCPYTDKLITDPLAGHYEHSNPHMIEYGAIGIHIPQFIIPDFLVPREWSKIYNYYKDFGDTRTLQEVCGIALESGTREITQADLQNMCSMPYENQHQALDALLAGQIKYRFIVSGCDWGGSDYQMARQTKTSYTVHVVLGVTGDGKCDILWMKRYSGMQYDEIAADIASLHVKLRGTAIGSDYGAGYAYNTLLHRDSRINPTSHFVWEYNAPYAQMVTQPKHPMFPTHFLVNKTESITQLFMAIKEGRFRCYKWPAAQTHLSDILNSFRVHAESRHGRQYFLHIRNPANADDTLHAINFAFISARVLLREPMFDDPAVRDYVSRTVFGASGYNSGPVNLEAYTKLMGRG
jgi:hypothetical protein